MTMMTPEACRQYWSLAIRDLQPTHEVTLAYNNHRRGYAVHLDQVKADIERLHGLIDRRLYGPRFYKRKIERRTAYIGCAERKESNLHVHLAWRVPEDNKKIFTTAIKAIWCDPEGSRTMSVKTITDLAGWASYMCKDLDPRDPDIGRMVIVG